jgi:restriction endonuclease S subunit
MEVKFGFKQTEVGVIPMDWDVKTLFDLADRKKEFFDDGDWIESEHITSMGVRLIQTGNIGVGSFLEKEVKKYIYENSFTSLKCKLLQKGDLLVCRLADPAGRACLLPDIGEERVVTSVDVTIFRPLLSAADRRFLLNLFSTQEWFRAVSDRSGGTTHKRIARGALGKIAIQLPPLSEQEAIAEALSDADALIESLSLLLAKKRQIKQGAMQELLTGKKRLPGFSGAWSEKSLGELFQFSGGLSASRDQLSTNGHLYLHYGDIHTSTKSFVDVVGHGDSMPRLDIPLGRIQPTALLADGDVVFVDASEDDDGVSKHVVVLNPHGAPFIAGLHTIVAKQRRKELEDAYLRHCFQTRVVKEQYKFYAVGTKVSGISKKNIAKIMLSIPAPEEQSAIAKVLDSMDANIDTLEIKLSKVRQLKQGMMQALLTGRIRLTQPVPNVVALPVKPVVANPSSSQPSKPAHNWQINEAVVISVLTQRFGSEKLPLGRKRRVKLMYLLHRHVEGRADGYLKKAAGPYDPNTKYKGPEAIALKNGYVRAVHNDKYEGFVAGDKIEQAQRYFEQWYGTVALEWLEQFHYRKTDDLELLATVDMAIMDLAAAGQTEDVVSVKRVVAAHPEWEAKLSRELFSDDNIASAIAECHALFGG